MDFPWWFDRRISYKLYYFQFGIMLFSKKFGFADSPKKRQHFTQASLFIFGRRPDVMALIFLFLIISTLVWRRSTPPHHLLFPKVLDAIAALASFVVQCLESIHSPDWSLCESLWKAAFDLGKAFIYSCSNWSHFSTIPIWWVFLLERRIGM